MQLLSGKDKILGMAIILASTGFWYILMVDIFWVTVSLNVSLARSKLCAESMERQFQVKSELLKLLNLN
jgi:hypothetical protein